MFIQEGLESGNLYSWLTELGWSITDSSLEFKDSITQKIKLSSPSCVQTISFPAKDFMLENYA
jgi:hypothetical protein